MPRPSAPAEPPRSVERELADSLRPAVEQAIYASARENTTVLSEALFPVIGPAIRQAVWSAWNEIVETLNHILEESLSGRSLRWRWEAFRTGQPLGEIAYLHSIVYSVEQVFLIHRHTGLVLQHLTSQTGKGPDADVVSAMLTAIQDFVRDSFALGDKAPVRNMRVGDHLIWVESGPEAMLVLMIRGQGNPELRAEAAAANERLHSERARDLLAFTGDTSFPDCAEVLQPLLSARIRPASGPRGRLLTAAVGVALLVLLSFSVLRARAHFRWTGYLRDLRATPGIVVTSASSGWIGCRVDGLRDPLSPNPEDLLARAGMVPATVSYFWVPYLSLAPEVIVSRARAMLEPPPSVTLAYRHGVLRLSGSASHRWIASRIPKAAMLPGVLQLDAGELTDIDFESYRQQLGAHHILFSLGSHSISSDQSPDLARTLALVRSALAIDDRASVVVVGHADPPGSPDRNRRLSAERSAFVGRFLEANGIPPARIERRAASESEGTRSVSFQLLITDASEKL